MRRFRKLMTSASLRNWKILKKEKGKHSTTTLWQSWFQRNKLITWYRKISLMQKRQWRKCLNWKRWWRGPKKRIKAAWISRLLIRQASINSRLKNTFAASEIKSRTLTGIKSNFRTQTQAGWPKTHFPRALCDYNEMVDEIFQLIVIAGRVCDEHGYVTKS